MSIGCEAFGRDSSGTRIELYTLSNRNGVEARIASYGATLVSLRVPDRDGRFEDVVLGFDGLEGYLGNHPYFGCTIGRYANRIAGGTFVLGPARYHLPCNDGENHLHGGPGGFHTVVWTATADDGAGGPHLALRYTSADGEQGYPGALDARVAYTLTERNELRLDYTAIAERPTIANLTNHTYFNLAGRGTVLDHVLRIAAQRFLPIDKRLIPTGELRAVRGTPFDFTTACSLRSGLAATDAQLAIPGGYDHSWVLDDRRAECAFAAELYDVQSGRVMTVLKTQPGLQVYSGNFLDGTLRGKQGIPYARHAGICLETQHFPDSPNQPAFPSTVVSPSVPFEQTTIYAFDTRDS